MAFDINSLNELDLSTVSDLPWPVKSIIILVACALLLISGFWFINKPQLEELDKQKNQEVELKADFETAQRKAANLEAYKKQLLEIKQKFGELLQKLPRKTEVPGLLEEISTAGSSSGLRVEMFKPLNEVQSDFFAELPVEIQVVGSFHQIGEFISKLSAMDRIVTIHDFQLTANSNNSSNSKDNGKSNRSSSNRSSSSKGAAISAVNNPDELMFKLIAKTYRTKE